MHFLQLFLNRPALLEVQYHQLVSLSVHASTLTLLGIQCVGHQTGLWVLIQFRQYFQGYCNLVWRRRMRPLMVVYLKLGSFRRLLIERLSPIPASRSPKCYLSHLSADQAAFPRQATKRALRNQSSESVPKNASKIFLHHVLPNTFQSVDH